MRDDALRPAYCQTTPATAWRRTRAITASPLFSLPARLARAARRAAAVLAPIVIAFAASTAAHASGHDCQHATFDGASVERLTVCVSRQAFDNDVYVLRLNGKTALRGTDDEVAHGVFARVGNRLVAMRCEAEESPARVSPAVAQALSWQTGVRVQRITDALGSVETGRRCTVKIDGADAGRLTFAFN
ncbi:hypothetical protein PI93_005430 [Pandoraea fibrosis]|uniref:Uncharacterized protein n=1 Tax=Pandoraea fibrosis TaxID=1891094 RepID=A0ABX6HN63_9BURK|nr:hypothetical protein [Pandoraea fibrosis]QHE94283.1 hypothetical protein PJ20_022565 [Pandoraea fibrosis]QHF12153.1 hypothetical protein PI93_005430 [Pandoraea fibrosis]